MYIVYEKESTRSLFWQSYGGVKLFKSESAAKAALTREIKKRDAKNDAYENKADDEWMNKPYPRIDREDYAIAEAVDFSENIEKSEIVRNLMNGEPVIEKVNTPNFLSVSSEAYWSA